MTLLTSHWTRHPWAPGERRLHWYLLPAPHVFGAAQRARSRLAGPGWDVVPDDWLHCTVASLRVGAADLAPPVLRRVVDRVSDAVDGLARPAATGEPDLSAEGLIWRLEPQAPFEAIWRAVTRSCAELLATPAPATYLAHVTLAYPSAEVDGAPPLAALQGAGAGMPRCVFPELHLLDVRRDPGSYRWDPVASVALGG